MDDKGIAKANIGALQGFEVIRHTPRGKWLLMLDEFHRMSADCIGKMFSSHNKAESARVAIRQAIKKRGYRMSTTVQGRMVYVVKDGDDHGSFLH